MTIEELLEIEEIKNLRLGYSAYYDSNQPDKLADLFCDDAVCEFSPEYGGDWVGKETIRNNYTHWIADHGDPFNVLHAVTNPWITLSGSDTAHGRWYLIDLRTTPGVENPLIWCAVYEDDYRKVDGVWKIARVRLHFLWPTRHFLGLNHP